MQPSAVTLELSISYVAWINSHLRAEAAARHYTQRVARRDSAVRNVLFASIASVCIALASLLVT